MRKLNELTPSEKQFSLIKSNLQIHKEPHEGEPTSHFL